MNPLSQIKIARNKREELANFFGVEIGSILFGNDLIADDCVLENTLYDEKMDILFFVKYHRLNKYEWFTLNFYDFKSKTGYQFYREFEMLYLKEFTSENEIHIYESFSDQSGNNFYFKLNEEEFGPVN